MKGMSLTCKMVSKWCNPSITYQKILIFQGKIPTFNKTLTILIKITILLEVIIELLNTFQTTQS